jgi:hypothetical protein
MVPTVAPAAIGAPPQVLPMAGINVLPQVNNAGIPQTISNPALLNGRNPSALQNMTPGASIRNDGYLLGGTKASFDDEFSKWQTAGNSTSNQFSKWQDDPRYGMEYKRIRDGILDQLDSVVNAQIQQLKDENSKLGQQLYKLDKGLDDTVSITFEGTTSTITLRAASEAASYVNGYLYGMKEQLRSGRMGGVPMDASTRQALVRSIDQYQKMLNAYESVLAGANSIYKQEIPIQNKTGENIQKIVELEKKLVDNFKVASTQAKSKIEDMWAKQSLNNEQITPNYSYCFSEDRGGVISFTGHLVQIKQDANPATGPASKLAGQGPQSACAVKCPAPHPSPDPGKVATTNDQPKAKIDPEKLAQLKQQYADALKNDSAKFSGKDGDKFYGPDPKLAADLANVVKNYPNIDFTVPSNIPIVRDVLPIFNNNFDIEFDQNQRPTVSVKQGNPYATATVDIQETLKNSIINSDGNLAPADVMKLALDAANGNYALAVLAANNLLKEVAKSGRDDANYIRQNLNSTNFTDPNNANFDKTQTDMANKVQEFNIDADLAGKLISMRNAPGDKMGEWYHAFTILSMQVVTDSAGKAESLATGEQILRTTRGFGGGTESPVDPEKRVSDFNFVKVNYLIQDQQHPILAVLTAPSPVEVRGPVDMLVTLANKGYRLYDWFNGTSSNYGHSNTDAIRPPEPIFHPVPGESYKPPLGKKFD